MIRKPRLSAEDWISAAFRALTTGGPQAVRAEAIARDLGVSKGSFYWHFEDVPALKSAMLEHWMDVATRQIITTVEYSRLDPAEQLRLLVRIAASNGNAAYGGRLAEAAIRDWARYDVIAVETLQTVDRLRLDFLAQLFGETGQDTARAHVSASLLYAALIGLEQLAHHGLAEATADLAELLEILLDARQDSRDSNVS